MLKGQAIGTRRKRLKGQKAKRTRFKMLKGQDQKS